MIVAPNPCALFFEYKTVKTDYNLISIRDKSKNVYNYGISIQQRKIQNENINAKMFFPTESVIVMILVLSNI